MMDWRAHLNIGKDVPPLAEPQEALPPEFDVVVVGGGINGLTCATYLARSGKRVVLFEATPHLGGAAQSGQIGKEVRSSRAAHIIRHFDPNVIQKLKLHRFGFHYAAKRLPTIALGEEGRHLLFGRAPWVAGGSLIDYSESDAERFIVFHRQLSRITKAIWKQDRIDESDHACRESRMLWPKELAGLNKMDQALFNRMSVSSIAHLLEELFETPLLQGALAFDAVLGRAVSPYWPGTANNLASLWSGEVSGHRGALALPRGGMGALADALGRSLLHFGGTFRTHRRVVKVLAEDGAAKGVEIEGGAKIFAPTVVCAAAESGNLFRTLGEQRSVPAQNRQNRRSGQGAIAKLNLELDGLPASVGMTADELPDARYLIAPSLSAIEDAFVPSKYGQFSSEPIMEMVIPSLSDPSLKTGKCYGASIIVQFAPYHLDGGWEASRDKFIENCARTLSHYFPDFASRIQGGELLSPPDLEREFGVAGGNWHKSNASLQSSKSKSNDCNARRGPLDGLFLCGASTHPGGGVRGTSGRLAAELILSIKK